MCHLKLFKYFLENPLHATYLHILPISGVASSTLFTPPSAQVVLIPSQWIGQMIIILCPFHPWRFARSTETSWFQMLAQLSGSEESFSSLFQKIIILWPDLYPGFNCPNGSFNGPFHQHNKEFIGFPAPTPAPAKKAKTPALAPQTWLDV